MPLPLNAKYFFTTRTSTFVIATQLNDQKLICLWPNSIEFINGFGAFGA
jgi:hypothetical protein